MGDFAKADYEWLDPLLETMAKNAELLVEDKLPELMNRLSQNNSTTNATEKTKPQKKAKSHIHQARNAQGKLNKPNIEPTGPMAEMLKKLLGKKD